MGSNKTRGGSSTGPKVVRGQLDEEALGDGFKKGVVKVKRHCEGRAVKYRVS